MSEGQSLIHDGYAVLRLRETVKTRRRTMKPHGQFGSLVCLPLELALRLVEEKAAKVPAASSRMKLRMAVQRQREAAEAAAIAA